MKIRTKLMLVVALSSTAPVVMLSAYLLFTLPTQAVALFNHDQGVVVLLIFIGVMVAVMAIGGRVATRITDPINTVAQMLNKMSEGSGDLTQRLDIKSKGEVGSLALSFDLFVARLQAIIADVVDTSGQLNSVSEGISKGAHSSLLEMQEQLQQITMMAASVEEMSAATHEIAANAEHTARAADESAEFTEDGKNVVMKARDSISQLAHEVANAGGVIHRLHDHSQQITSILSTIQGIAEQTNLLALNAAIEAARAGEQGRGFAVVADEVRDLSVKTHRSTEEIQLMISSLQAAAKQAVDIMQGSGELADSSVVEANAAYEQLVHITSSVDNIRDMATQIATATEQQKSVHAGISASTQKIQAVASNTTSSSDRRMARSQLLSNLAEGMYGQVGDYKV